jgi:hypothetical protein
VNSRFGYFGFRLVCSLFIGLIISVVLFTLNSINDLLLIVIGGASKTNAIISASTWEVFVGAVIAIVMLVALGVIDAPHSLKALNTRFSHKSWRICFESLEKTLRFLFF